MLEPVVIIRYGIQNKDPKWYKSRLPFARKCVDSLRQQTYKNFQVLFLVDDSIPAESLTDLNRVAFDDRMDISKRGVKEPFKEATIQIRLDSDDYIANDFIEKVMEHIQPGHVMYFRNGYIERAGKFYEKSYPFNMFLALWAKESIYQTAHDLMGKRYPSVSLSEEPMWIHNVHDMATTWDKNKKRSFGKAVKPDLDRFAFLA